VDTAEDLDAGLAQLRGARYDVVLLGTPLKGSIADACFTLRTEGALGTRPLLLLPEPGAPLQPSRVRLMGAFALLPPDPSQGVLADAVEQAVAEAQAREPTRVGLVAPADLRGPVASALKSAGYLVDELEGWPSEVPRDWSVTVAAEPPPLPTKAPVVPLWIHADPHTERWRPLADTLELVTLAARPTAPEGVPSPASPREERPPALSEVVTSERILRDEVLPHARAQLQILEELVRRLSRAPSDAEVLRELSATARNLSSLATGYGLTRTAEPALRIGEWVQHLTEGRARATVGALVKLADLLLELDSSLRLPPSQAPASGPPIVLLVDDDPFLSAQIPAAAPSEGIQAVVAGSVEELAELSLPERIDLVFVSSSVLVDPAATREIRAVPALAQAPIAVLVSPESVEGRLAAVRLSAVEILERPVTAVMLLRVARRLLTAQSPRRPGRILVIGGQPLCEALGQQGFDVTLAVDTANDWLASQEPDAIVLDERAQAAREVLATLRNDPRLRSVVVLMVCSDESSQRKVRALEAGADDAVGPTSSGAEIAGRLRARQERLKSLQLSRSRDPATGLATLRRMLDRLEDEVAIAERSHRPFNFASIEVDPGEQDDPAARDALTVALAREIHSRVRRSDLVARASEGEILLLLRECTCDDAKALLESVQHLYPQRSARGVATKRSFSAGIASYPDHGHTAETLLSAARRARLDARRAGATALLQIAQSTVLDALDRSRGRTSPRTVFVADEDENVRRILEFALRKRGFEVELFDNGADLERRLFQEASAPEVDLVILELHLPFVHGFDLLRRLQEHPGRRKPRAILLSGGASESDIVRAFTLGIADHVSKPFSLQVLMARVLAALGREGGR
jgi:diguanylate cyclase (GGDEF)-like protein